MDISFSNTVRKLRENKNITIEQIRLYFCLSTEAYICIENGAKYPTCFMLDKLSDLFNVSVNYLLTGVHYYDNIAVEQLPLTSKDSFSLWLYKYIYSKRSDVGYNQICSYHTSSQRILAFIGSKPLDGIVKEDISFLLKRNTKCSKRTLKAFKGLIKQVFEYAIDCREYNYNPALTAKIPKNAADAVETKNVSSDMTKIILEFHHEFQLPAVIMLLAGLRRGELLALKYSDIHLRKGYISINKVVEFQHGSPVLRLNDAKTESGIRKVFLPKTLQFFIGSYISNCPFIKGDDYVVHNKEGGLVCLSTYRRKWNKYIKDLNSYSYNKAIKETFTSKQLRHTYATMLYKSKLDLLTTKSQLGHKNSKTTLDFYCHLDDKYKENKINDFDNFLVSNNLNV